MKEDGLVRQLVAQASQTARSARPPSPKSGWTGTRMGTLQSYSRQCCSAAKPSQPAPADAPSDALSCREHSHRRVRSLLAPIHGAGRAQRLR